MEFKWTTKYSVNNELIDVQHRMLFAIINDLNTYIINGQGLENIEEILNKMSAYATLHFRTEEDILLKSNYTEYQKHKDYHDSFKKQILKSTQEVISNKNEKTVIEIHRFLMNWLTSHILDEDVKYSELLN
ncbi:bacteriohemerythrin [Acidaminobacter sp. JC074]|uniref:bacteriohemerythrin n=1 Tax=Acidaminobacter sp. JC074 TaxID=2530199 RepID=UPI001F0D55ED|nr:hemerythrin family protein [Acidaminobacter sp. JC074]